MFYKCVLNMYKSFCVSDVSFRANCTGALVVFYVHPSCYMYLVGVPGTLDAAAQMCRTGRNGHTDGRLAIIARHTNNALAAISAGVS